MRALRAIMRHTSRVEVCGLTGKVRVCREPLHSSGIMTLKTEEQAGNEEERHCKCKHKTEKLIKCFQKLKDYPFRGFKSNFYRIKLIFSILFEIYFATKLKKLNTPS